MNARFPMVHHVVDYAVGILLLIGPWLFGFADHLTATAVTIAPGAALIANSVFATDTRMPFRIGFVPHLLVEAALGGLMIAAPWVFGFHANTWVPHVVVGIVVAARAALLAMGVTVYRELSNRTT